MHLRVFQVPISSPLGLSPIYLIIGKNYNWISIEEKYRIPTHGNYRPFGSSYKIRYCIVIFECSNKNLNNSHQQIPTTKCGTFLKLTDEKL